MLATPVQVSASQQGRSILLQIALATCLLFVTITAWAQRPILTIQGLDQPVVLTLSDLQAMPDNTVSTETIWTDKRHTFSSVRFKDLFEELKVDTSGKKITMIALNDYSIEVDVDTLVKHNAFIAYAMDGKTMRIRDKGPLWVLYPFSD
ncbi:molybdopterin-dependent oxidoreductase, partial [Oceanospirillum sp. HFRX-1_2]